MNPKTLQYLVGHSEISVTMDVYTHLGLDDAKDKRLSDLKSWRTPERKSIALSVIPYAVWRVSSRQSATNLLKLMTILAWAFFISAHNCVPLRKYEQQME